MSVWCGQEGGGRGSQRGAFSSAKPQRMVAAEQPETSLAIVTPAAARAGAQGVDSDMPPPARA